MASQDEPIKLTPNAIDVMIEEMKEGKLSKIIYEQFPSSTTNNEPQGNHNGKREH